MALPVRALLAAGAVTAAVVAGGVLVLGGSEEEEPAAEQTEQPFTTTSLADYDTSTVAVQRGPFCDAVDDRQVEAVLGSAPDALTWADGDEIALGGAGSADVVHEFGCSYAVQDVGQAGAWVFAPPVGAQQAERLVRSARKGAGCEAGTGPPFGSPTLALTCTEQDGTARASYRGLFGDAWLVCEVALPPGEPGTDPLDVAGRWCVGILEAVRVPA